MKSKMKNWGSVVAPLMGTVCGIGPSDGGGDGGEGGSGGGQGPSLPEGLSEDGVKFLDQRIHSALGAHLTRFRSSFEKDLDKKLESQFAPIGQQLSGITDFVTSMKDQPAPTPKGSGGGPVIPQEWEARFSDMQKKYEGRIADLEEKNRQEAEARGRERNERLQSEERHALGQALSGAGIDGPRARAAMALLYNEDKRISRDDDGNIVFLVPKAGYTDQVKLEEGVSEWMKTEEGKAFLPARGANGSGGRGSAHTRGNKAPSRAEREADAKMALAQAMGVVPNDPNGAL